MDTLLWLRRAGLRAMHRTAVASGSLSTPVELPRGAGGTVR